MATKRPQPLLPYRFCEDCGVSLSPAQLARHSCHPVQRAAYQARRWQLALRDLEGALAAYLDTPRGRFDLWCARNEAA